MKTYHYSQGRRWSFEYSRLARYWRLGFFISLSCIGIQVPPISLVFFYRPLRKDALRQAHP
jgi:hypothetical protein